MDWEKWCLRVSAAAVIGAILLRLSSGGMLGTVVEALSSPEVLSVMLYLETGRLVRPAQPQLPEEIQNTAPEETEQTPLPEQQMQEPVQAVFAEADAALVEVNSVCGYDTDLPALLQQPLDWELTQQGGKTHGSDPAHPRHGELYQNGGLPGILLLPDAGHGL